MKVKEGKIESCEINYIHEELVEKVAKEMQHKDLLIRLADFFKVLGDGTRIRILSVLKISEMCVCDIAAVLDMNQSAISHQLRVLKDARLVKNRRDGKVVYYSLDDHHIQEVFDQGLEHIKHI